MMYLFIASGLLIVCGIVDATIYNPRTQTYKQLMERRQRSIGLQYPQGYHYNPIEPPVNDLDSLKEALESRINTYKQRIEISNHDMNLVPKTHSYQPKNPLYDSEYVTVQNIPSLFPEDSYDYKYLGLPLNQYLTQPSSTESDIPINLVAIKKTSVVGYGFPSYQSPYSSDSAWNLGSKIPNTLFGESQSVETDPETFKVSSPTVRIVELLPETLQQDPIAMPKLYPNYSLLLKLLNGNPNEVKNSAEDESIYEITQVTPTEDESDSITTEETQTETQSNILVLEENLTENESNSITTEETQTIPMSKLYPNYSLLIKLLRENAREVKNSAEDESIYEITQGTPTEDESDSITTEETQTENESNILVLEENLTEDESNSITTEETPAEEELNSQVFDSMTTEETQAKDDESKSTTSQETTTAFKLNYAFGKNFYLDSDENIKTKALLKEYEKFITDQHIIPPFYTSVDNILAKPQSNLLSDEDTNQKVDTYDEYDK